MEGIKTFKLLVNNEESYITLLKNLDKLKIKYIEIGLYSVCVGVNFEQSKEILGFLSTIGGRMKKVEL